jgi:hypothetical protein
MQCNAREEANKAKQVVKVAVAKGSFFAWAGAWGDQIIRDREGGKRQMHCCWVGPSQMIRITSSLSRCRFLHLLQS